MKKNLHILFLCSWYPSRVLPTNGDFIQRHAEAVNLNHHVSVLHIISDKDSSKSFIDIKTINGIPTYIGYVKPSSNPLVKMLRFIKIYKDIIAKIKPFDMVHLNGIYPFGLFALHQKKVANLPYIISEHWTDYKFPFSKKIGFIQKYLSKKITKNASFVCPVTNDLAESMQKFGLAGNYHPVPNVVDTDVFTNKTLKSHPTFKILHISNMLDSQKNISGILNTVKRLQEHTLKFEIKFIGGHSNSFAKKAKHLGILQKNIHFIKHIPHHNLVQHLQEASVFVLFSSHENLPCVILEAFATGTPVISTNVGGIKEYFPENFGQLITVNNEDQLFEALLSYYKKEIPVATPISMHNYVNENFSKQQLSNIFTSLYFKSLY